MKKYKIKRTVTLCLVLFVAVFVGTYLVAKMLSRVDGTSRPVSIAKWNVSRIYKDYDDTVSTGNGTVSLVAGNDVVADIYKLEITSTSEVTANYAVVLSNLPSNIQVKIDNGEFVSPVNNSITFESSDYRINYDASSRTRTHTLTFYMPIDLDFDATTAANINLRFTQID